MTPNGESRCSQLSYLVSLCHFFARLHFEGVNAYFNIEQEKPLSKFGKAKNSASFHNCRRVCSATFPADPFRDSVSPLAFPIVLAQMLIPA